MDLKKILKKWTKLLGTNVTELGESVAISADGTIYITGITLGNLDGQTNEGNENMFENMFLTKYNPDGDKVWTQLGCLELCRGGKGIATSADGFIYITGYAGYIYGNLDGQTSSSPNDSAFLTKYNQDGDKIWTRLLGTYDERGHGVAISSEGNIYITGYSVDINFINSYDAFN